MGNLISGIWTIASLTVTEVMRKRLWLAILIVAGIFVLLALVPFHVSERRQEMLGSFMDRFIEAQLGLIGSHIIEFFGFLFAIGIGGGAISAEIERGTLAVILPKPMPRWAVYTGKWLGINLVLLPMIILLTVLLQWSEWMHVHHLVPGLWRAIPVMYLYPLVFLSLALCFSTFSSNILATILPIIIAATAWSEGILKTIGYTFDIHSLQLASKYIVYVAPLNPMSRWLDRAENFTILQQFSFNRFQGPTDPPANMIDLAWILGYAAAAWVIGLIVFQKRDL